jgi:DNA-binding CsgD family transcriptional regulator
VQRDKPADLELELSMKCLETNPGVLVIDSSLNLVATNTEAIRILSFPEPSQQIANLDRWLTSKVRSHLIDRDGSKSVTFVDEFRSAKRTYLCRAFPLNLGLAANRSGPQGSVVFMERKSNNGIRMSDVYERFGLTPREQQTVEALLEGLTSKEIAEQMKISPNTVKAFIRLVMVKMNVSTRSGIVGKLVGNIVPF